VPQAARTIQVFPHQLAILLNMRPHLSVSAVGGVRSAILRQRAVEVSTVSVLARCSRLAGMVNRTSRSSSGYSIDPVFEPRQ
jgi:hypothetical protein